MASDSLDLVYRKFFDQRSKPLIERLPGYYRAVVVEVNDPLRMYRLRFKCPDMHDFDLKPEECPWAVSAFDAGTKRHGRWSAPCIGDWVWITFERNNPNAPVWVGLANPTRRKFYAYPSVFGSTPVPVNEDGKPQSPPDDFNQDYMPKDERPMSHGWQDRYGNMTLHSSTGFYPKEHDEGPAPVGFDAVQNGQYKASVDKPKVNEPDVKQMTELSKYGNMFTLGDQGYWWYKDGDHGEFNGDCDKDEKFEIKRWKYLQKLLNEDQPDSAKDGKRVEFGDQRRIESKTRYGSKIEIRDVGWAQRGPVESKSRDGEYDSPAFLSKEDTYDFRWIKLRTKAGMLIQMYDKGAHPNDDKFVKRKLLEECAHQTEEEHTHWKDKDARFIRIVTRYGFKFVLDDRGSDDKDAEGLENPRGNGVLIKGRRTPKAAMERGEGDERGFFMEFNENDELNHLTIGSPLGHVFEQNDRYEYTMLAASLGKEYSTQWQKLKENEFLLAPAMKSDPERTSHHLKLDHENEYVRLKTRSGKGPKPDHVVNESGVEDAVTQQGFEARDGSQGDGPWVEMVDCDGRGLWCSHAKGVTAWRAKSGEYMFQFMDEKAKVLGIINGKPGDDSASIKLVCSGSIELYALDKVNVMATGDVNLKSKGGNINLQAGETKVTIDGTNPIIRTNAEFRIGPDDALEPEPPEPPQLEPTDRGKTYNDPFEAAESKVVEHPVEPVDEPTV